LLNSVVRHEFRRAELWFGGHLLRLAEVVRQFAADGNEAAPAIGRREREVEADRNGTVFG